MLLQSHVLWQRAYQVRLIKVLRGSGGIACGKPSDNIGAEALTDFSESDLSERIPLVSPYTLTPAHFYTFYKEAACLPRLMKVDKIIGECVVGWITTQPTLAPYYPINHLTFRLNVDSRGKKQT